MQDCAQGVNIFCTLHQVWGIAMKCGRQYWLSVKGIEQEERFEVGVRYPETSSFCILYFCNLVFLCSCISVLLYFCTVQS